MGSKTVPDIPVGSSTARWADASQTLDVSVEQQKLHTLIGTRTRMAIPDYQTIMLPLLRLVGDGREYTAKDTIHALVEHFQLTEAERTQLLTSGHQNLFGNRVGWARTYLKQAGLLASHRRGVVRITDRGVALLNRRPGRIDNGVLGEYPEFRKFRPRARGRENQSPTTKNL